MSNDKQKMQIEFGGPDPVNNAKRKYVVCGIVLIGVAFGLGILAGVFIPRGESDHSGQDGTATVTQGSSRPPATSIPIPNVCRARVKPVVLVALDGFRWNFFNRGFSPNISKFAASGVRAEYLQSSFPTISFPNLYTLVTGLYPAYHGIVAHSFYDPALNEYYQFGTRNSTQSKWWGGEPIWVTARKNNMKSASYFWVGSATEIEGYRPNYWYTYNSSISFMDRVDQFFKWMELPDDERPDMVALYFDQPDHTGFRRGPDSDQVNEQIRIVDEIIGAITHGLQIRGMEDCVNVIVVGDHGLKKTCCNRIIYFDQYINTTDKFFGNSGASGGIRVRNGNVDEVVNKMRCKNKNWKVYKKEELPIRLHYDSLRVPEIVVIPDDNWLVRPSSNVRPTLCSGGHRGFDNLDPDMRTIFMARGPAFKQGLIIKPFTNIEIYNLMTTILEIPPAENNGTMGRLHHILKNPPTITKVSTGQSGNICRVPQDSNVVTARTTCSACVCSSCDVSIRANLSQSNDALRMTTDQEKHSENRNFPWGVPKYVKNMDTCTLYQPKYISGYSNDYHMPLFAGYFLSDKEMIARKNQSICYRRDIRLDIATQTSNCSNYENSNYEKGRLMPSSDVGIDMVAQANSQMLSNIVPLHYAFKTGIWSHLEMLIHKWSKNFGGVFVISGAIIKSDHQTVMSNSSYWLNNQIGSVAIPTHMYKIVVKCEDSDQVACNGSATNFKPCGGKLDAMAFILPHTNSTSPQCHSTTSQIFEHVSSIADIEKLTGIDFFPELSAELQVILESQIPTELWSIF